MYDPYEAYEAAPQKARKNCLRTHRTDNLKSPPYFLAPHIYEFMGIRCVCTYAAIKRKTPYICPKKSVDFLGRGGTAE